MMEDAVITLTSTISITHQQIATYGGTTYLLSFGDIVIESFGDTPRRCKIVLRDPDGPNEAVEHIEINPWDDPAKKAQAAVTGNELDGEA